MTSQEDALLAELAIEKYAEAKKLDVKTVKQKWLPVLEAMKDKDAFTESLINACSLLTQIKEVGKGLPPETQQMLGTVSNIAVRRALNPEEREPEDGDDKLVRTIRRIKLLDHAFTDEDALTEKIAKTLSQEVAAPLAEALKDLKPVLEKITEKAQAEPEVYAENSEFAELSRTMENINTTLVHMAERIEKGRVSPVEAKEDVESMVERLNSATEKSKTFLETRGYKITPGESPATFEEAQKIVEERGFKLQDQRVSRDEADRMAQAATEAERKKHEEDLELKLEERKIAAAEKVVGTAIDKVMEPFKYFLERYLDTTVGELPPSGASPAATNPPAAPAPAPPPPPPKKPIKIEGPPPQP